MSKESRIYWSRNVKREADKITHEVEFVVDENLGIPGAIMVTNKYQEEFYLESIDIEGVVHFSCNSWVQPHTFSAQKRIFFSNKAYLPKETPMGLKELRKKEMKQLRGAGDGGGIRRVGDRIYEYDVYNDLGNPDKGDEHVRPILGGQYLPYPRRCRSNRPPTNSDVKTESPVSRYIPKYVPRDEAFEDSKTAALSDGKWKATLRCALPMLKQASSNTQIIHSFSHITDLYKQIPPFGINSRHESRENLLHNMIKQSIQHVFKFDPPKLISRDIPSCCLRDDELGRLSLAGMNPLSIERLKVFPPVSRLDPCIYASQESALKEEHIISHLNGMTVQQAIEENKLFILDYHDVYLPFLDRINTHPTKRAYATRTIFVLTDMGSLKPIAIELSLLEKNQNVPSKRVVTPAVDATTCWLWQLSKAHVCSNDAGAHQLIHHWLRTHACLEPFIIAAHRQLSVMHPIYKLLHPHMRYTLDVNAQGRQLLLNAGGKIETHLFTAECSMEVCASVYRNWWRFDMESLPADLIRRGMAVPDASKPHGLKLLIEDYPYATDGLLIWSAIEQLVKTYVYYYYPEANSIESDSELNAWYYECINVGHADICHASWWPKLSTPNDLISILTTIIWLASGHHAAVNFGMYPYGGYFPVRPPFMRRLLPNEHEPDYASFLADPEGYFLASLPSLGEMLRYISVLHILSSHSDDEEYLGDRKDLSTWNGDPEIVEAFYKFSMEMKKIEKEIEKRNGNPKLRNRCGAGISPYELLLPSSGPGVTCRGVPNSVSI
ncbi:lipoxygenase 3, Arabidopsis thaliana lipoxygenase 3 [Hibiscus trionum]|uniref:Lipoxygenase n=1 Tax=Hibiscus trionum TaxID=183268 RepID=A0A9W7I4M8_HIBTR|nr:lipoxygenase 3, Arabidopsis thaliana lipoxygenase 3 [Hibiscus trionum]